MKLETSIAEALDKLSILEIKRIRISNYSKLEKVNKEYEIIKAKIISLLNIVKINDIYMELLKTNGRLWIIEDDIRELEEAREFGKKFVTVARSVYIMNDKRCDLKSRIDKILNSNITEIKSYKSVDSYKNITDPLLVNYLMELTERNTDLKNVPDIYSMKIDKINMNNISTYPFIYPILLSNNFLNNDFYNSLKKSWPDFKNFSTDSCGQVKRNNLELIKDNENYKKINPNYRLLYDSLNSNNFRQYLNDTFKLNEKEGFKGDFFNSKLVMHIAESTTGYENPWHVDTRGRIIHFLIYFGKDEIIKGGELGIAEHKKLNSFLHYKQYPEEKDLTNIQYIEPNDNTAVFILSQNNSYHKGCYLQGKRKFIYAGYTNKIGPSWDTGNWSMSMNFEERKKKLKAK
tara:strand:- start:202 stop:1410 length:1209 start_codon:yes stop_codon:yes gene_type:complete